MSYSRFNIWMIRILILVLGIASVQAYANGDEALSISLRVLNPTIQLGELPKLEIEIFNVSGEPIKVLNISSRPDLQDTYCEAIFTKNGKPFEHMVAISDPGSVRDRDIVSLSPNEKLIINLEKPNIDPSSLKPGHYEVYVAYRPNPNNFSKVYRSKKISFVVKK